MIQPVLADDAFLADVAQARNEREAFHLWWLGQSGFLLQWQHRHLLMDPYLSDSLTRKYAGTDRPHVRMTARVAAPERLDFIDAVTSSHQHTDHFDPDTLLPLLQRNPALRIIVPETVRDTAADRLSLDPSRLVGIDDGVTVEAAGFRVTGVPAAHEELERDEAGRHRFLGYVVEFGSHTVYHSGDTVCYEGLADRLKTWKIDVALLPINGRVTRGLVPGNMSGKEAAALGREIGAGLVIPCHYEMFEFNTVSPGEFASEARRLGQPHRLMRAGERWSRV